VLCFLFLPFFMKSAVAACQLVSVVLDGEEMQ
jgi:hypothetical protein